MKILVTGGAGYVGSHCVRDLCDAGHDVVVLDNLSTGHKAAVDSRAPLLTVDLADSANLEDTFATGTFDAVMHFAAFSLVGESVQRPLLYYQNNVANTVNLLDAMRRHKVCNMVFSSTCATYGEPPNVPITEDMPQQPINPYGRTKLAIEWALRDSAAAWGLGATALRYFNASGASADATIGEDHNPETHLIPLVLEVALGQREYISVFGEDYPTPDGTCVRDYIHVNDLALAHRLALETQLSGSFRAFNVGTGSGASVKEVIEAARTVTGHDIPGKSAPRREGDPPELFANPSKIKRDLGWSPKFVEIEAVVESAWKWHQKHPKGFDDV